MRALVLRPLLAAFGFLTRLPVAGAHPADQDLGRSVAFFPVVGLALGLAVAAGAFVTAGLVSPLLRGALLAALLAILTGGLHLDGLADLFDGLGAARGDRARMLEIMRDGRIGAFGAAALAFLVLAKVAALAEVLGRGDLLVVLVFPAVARAAVTPLVALFPYARPEGLGRAFAGHAGRREVGIAVAFTAGLLLVGGGARLLLPALVAGAVALALGVWLGRKLGGLTGDVYGAAIELTEVAFLVAALIA
jgi:adenosylcobinamide-GDP ribazoletransferase